MDSPAPSDAAPRDPPAAAIAAPLTCDRCGGLVPLVDADDAVCPSCGATVRIPDAHRAVREAARARTVDRLEAERLYAKLGKPPSRALSWAGRAAGGALSAIFLVVVGFLKGWVWALRKLELELFFDARTFWLPWVILFAPLLALYGGVYALARGSHALVRVLHVDLVAVYGLPRASVAIAACLYALLVLSAVYDYADGFTALRRQLKAHLAAKPPTREGGPALCRVCGAGLSIPKDALGVRCDYCGADNLVALPAWYVDAAQKLAGKLHDGIRAAAADERATRGSLRAHLVAQVLCGLLLVPLAWGCGALAEHVGPLAEGRRAAPAENVRVAAMPARGGPLVYVDLAPLPLTIGVPPGGKGAAPSGTAMVADAGGGVSIGVFAVHHDLAALEAMSEKDDGFRRWAKKDATSAIEEIGTGSDPLFMGMAYVSIGDQSYLCTTVGEDARVTSADVAAAYLEYCRNLVPKLR